MSATDGRSGNLYIALVVVLWENINYTGRKRQFIMSEPNLASGIVALPGANFNDTTSSVAVYPGPDYDLWKKEFGEPYVALYDNIDYGSDGEGEGLVFGVGLYPDLRYWHFNDKASSIRFLFLDGEVPMTTPKTPDRQPGPLGPIPIVLRLHTAGITQSKSFSEADNVITVVEPIESIRSQYGIEFYHTVSWVEVLKGPTWDVTWGVTLHSDERNNSLTFSAPRDADLVAEDFNDVLSSTTLQSEKLIYTGPLFQPSF